MSDLKKYKFVLEKTERYPVEIQARTSSEAKNWLLRNKNKVFNTKPIEVIIDAKTEKKYRTEQQNRALHKYFT